MQKKIDFFKILPRSAPLTSTLDIRIIVVKLMSFNFYYFYLPEPKCFFQIYIVVGREHGKIHLEVLFQQLRGYRKARNVVHQGVEVAFSLTLSRLSNFLGVFYSKSR